jgi:hypothetical protein
LGFISKYNKCKLVMSSGGLVEIKRLAGQNSTKKRPIRLYSRDSSSILDKSSIFFSVLIYFDEYNCTIFFGTEIDEYIFN